MTFSQKYITLSGMNKKRYLQIRALVALFVATMMAIAVSNNSFLLALTTVLTGMALMVLIRLQAKIKLDEREIALREKAAHLTYAIFAPTIGLGAVIMLIPTQGGFEVFSKGEFLYIESLGMILAYLSLFMIVVYSLSYFFLNRKYGGGSDEK